MKPGTDLPRQRHRWLNCCLLIGPAWLAVCTPYTTTRIGPPIPSRSHGCEIEVLEPGETPSRPYRDVGVVSLDNCQDYRILPCKEWLREAACRLGGQVAYVDEYQRPSDPRDEIVRAATSRVIVAAFVADIATVGKDPFYRSRTCSPPCAEGMRCDNGACRAEGSDCLAGSDPVDGGSIESADQKCLD